MTAVPHRTKNHPGGITARRVGHIATRSASVPDRTDRGAALALAGWVGALAAASLVARTAGVPDARAGGALAVLSSAVLGVFVGRRLRPGRAAVRALGWGVAILFASAAPTLVSVFPGPLLADGELHSPGDSVPLPPTARGRVRILVSAPLPHKAFMSFVLRGDHTVLDGTLSRGVRWWGAGEEKRHYHEDRTSVLLGAGLPAGAKALVLESLGGDQLPLRVRVFAAPLPAWGAPLISALIVLVFVLLHAERRRERAAVTAACVAACMGIAAGAIATPVAVLRPVLAGLVTGAVTGVPVGAVLLAAGRRFHRLASRSAAAWRDAHR